MCLINKHFNDGASAAREENLKTKSVDAAFPWCFSVKRKNQKFLVNKTKKTSKRSLSREEFLCLLVCAYGCFTYGPGHTHEKQRAKEVVKMK